MESSRPRSQISLPPKLILSSILGGLLTLAFAPFFYYIVLVICFPLLILLIRSGKTKWQAFFIAYVFGFVHHSTALYWISNALLVDRESFGWMVPLAMIAIPSALAVYIGIIGFVMHDIKCNKNYDVLVFSIAWLLMEYLRSNLLLPFPWNLIGYTANFSLEFMQILSVIGVYGLGYLIVFCSSSLYSMNIRMIMSSMAIILTIIGFGQYRLNHAPREHYYPNFKLRLVQPSFSMDYQGNFDALYDKFLRLKQLSLQPGYEDIDILIWPEAAFPFILSEDSEWIELLKSVAPAKGVLLLGADRQEYSAVDGTHKLYNSLFAIDRHKGVVGVHDKVQLVPFGEYIPLIKFFPLAKNFLKKITGGITDFTMADSRKSLHCNDGALHIIPLICYEVIFYEPEGLFIPGVSWFLNLSNDAWFGDSIGPYQHFEMARSKAVEYGIPLVRLSNNGLSGEVSAYGQNSHLLYLYESKIQDLPLSVGLPAMTLYGMFGNMAVLLTVCLTCFVSIFSNRGARRN